MPFQSLLEWKKYDNICCFRKTAYGAWSRRHGSLKFSSLISSTCRFTVPGIHALAAAVPVSVFSS